MKKVYLIFSILSVFFFANVFAWESCPLNFDPVCGEKQGVCVNGTCSKLLRTYSNKCFLQQDGASFLHKGECGKIVNSEKGTNPALNPSPKQGGKQTGVVETDNNLSKDVNDVVITDKIQKEIDTIVNSIILKLDGKSDKAKEIYITNFIKQLDKLTIKLKSQIQIKKYEIVKNRLMNIIKKDEQMTDKSDKNQTNVVVEKTDGDNINNSDDNVVSGDNKMKPYSFSSLGIQILAPSNWKFAVDGKQMVFSNAGQQFIVKLLEKKDNIENNAEVIKKTSEVRGDNSQMLDYTGEVLMSGIDKNQVISKYIRDKLCMKVLGGKRLAAYQTMKKDKPYSNVANYELMYLCQEYVKKGGKYIPKNTYSAPLKISLFRKDGVYSLIKIDKPSDGAGYVDDVKRIFSLQNQKVFLGEDAVTYNKIVDDLLNQNKSWVDENLK